MSRPILLVLLVIGMLAAACRDDPSPEEAKEQLCNDLAVLQNEVDALLRLTPTDTVAELQAAIDNVREAVDNAEQSATDYEEAVANNLASANDALDQAAEDLPGSVTVEQGLATLEPEIEAVSEARALTAEEVDCGLAGDATPTAAAGETPSAVAAAPTATAEPPPATAEPTATVEPSATPEPTATPEPPTATPEPPTATPEPTAAPDEPTPQPAAGTQVYAADWSAGAGDWQLPEGWLIENGALVAVGGEAATAAVAPFMPPNANYAVEVELAIQAAPGGCEAVVGMVGRAILDIGGETPVPTGVLTGLCPEQWLLGVQAAGSEEPQVLAQGEFAPADAAHLYRMELAGNRVRLFIDGAFAGEATFDGLTEPGVAGLYLDSGYGVTVSAFRIFEIQE